MAKKDEPGFIEKHLEKMVLAATAAALLVVLLFWVAASPRTLRLANDTAEYGPEQVDQALRQQAQVFKARLDGDKPQEEPIIDYARLAEILRSEPFDTSRLAGGLIQLTGGSLPLEMYESGGQKARGTLKLADLLPLPAPKWETLPNTELPVQIRREVQIVPQQPPAGAVPAAAPSAAAFKPVEVVAAHGAGVFEHGKLVEKWRAVLEQASVPCPFVVVAVEVERQGLQASGTWDAATRLSGPAPELNLPILPAFDGKNVEEVRRAIAEIGRSDVQQEIIEPWYSDIVWPDRTIGTWLIHKPRTPVSDLLLTTEVPGAGTERLYRPSPSMSPRPYYSPRQPRYTGVPNPDDMMREEMMRRAGNPLPSRSPAPPSPAPKPPPAPPAVKPTPAPPTVRPPPAPPAVVPKPVTPAPVGPEAAPAAPVPVTVPSLAQQLENPKGILEVWFHDTANLVEGRSYSYRYRLVLLNPLFGRFGDVASEDDAKQLTLVTAWSDWSPAVVVNRPTEFFLVGHFAENQTVRVEVFTQKWGQRVSSKFNVARGEPIGTVVNLELRPLTGEQVESVAVDFSTGAIAVDFDFERKLRLPSGITRTTTEMLYLDADGRLRTRTESEDGASPRFKDLEKEVKQGEEATKGPPGMRSP